MNFNALIEISYPQKRLAQITLNRPEKHNALNTPLIEALIKALEDIKANKEITVLAITANGKTFSAGADLEEMKAALRLTEKDNLQSAQQLAQLMQLLYNMPQTTVAKIQGSCFGGGLGLVAACDIAIATDDAKFKLSEVKLGLCPAVISPYVVEAIGIRAAKRYTLTAETFSSDRALNLGLIHECVSFENLENTFSEIITTLLQNGPNALKASKELLRHVHHTKLDENLIDYTVKSIAHIRCTPEGQEGLAAFFEKRPPNWQKK
jgi:methylglutaconyl-CoA hydratase